MKLDMSMKLSDRDKKMIIVAIAFVFLFASYTYLIKPEMDYLQVLNKQNAPVTSMYDVAINKSGFADTIAQSYTTNTQRLDALTNKKVSPYLTDEAIDKYFTDLLKKYGATIESLLIEYPQNTSADLTLQPYKYVELVNVTIAIRPLGGDPLGFISEVDKTDFLSIKSYNMQFDKDKQAFSNIYKVQMIMMKKV
jgi:hypothetical protein